MSIQFLHKDWSDGASEILTLVQIDGGLDYFIEICTGPGPGDTLIGLFDLDGDRIEIGNIEWTAVEEAPSEVIEGVLSGWANGTRHIERFPIAPE